MSDSLTAVILAGGAGTRLRPLTYARRKELVPVVNRPLLFYRFLNLRQHGGTDIVLACSQGMREIEEHFGDGASLGVRLRYRYEDRPLGSGRAVKEAARWAGAKGTLVVCNGDILTMIDLTAMLERHRATDATLSISLARVDDPWHFGVVETDEDLRIRRFVEKPPQGEEPSNLINAGTWLFEPEVLERVPDGDSALRDGFAERVLFPGIIADGKRVQGFEEDLWVDVGSPERYLLANRLLLDRTTASWGRDTMLEEGADVAAGARARIETGAMIEGPCVIGHDSIVKAGATVRASVLWEETTIGERATVEGSIVAAYAAVGDGAEVRERCRLEPGARVMPNERAGGEDA